MTRQGTGAAEPITIATPAHWCDRSFSFRTTAANTTATVVNCAMITETTATGPRSSATEKAANPAVSSSVATTTSARTSFASESRSPGTASPIGTRTSRVVIR